VIIHPFFIINGLHFRFFNLKKRKKMKKNLFIILFSILSFSFQAYSQEIEPLVDVNMERLDFEQRRYVSNLKYDLENYLRTQRFTEKDWEGPRIPVEMSIYFTGYSGTSGRNIYSAQLIITSKRNIPGTEGGTSIALQFLEKNWIFEYSTGAALSFNPTRFNEFTSLIDYYMFIVIGYDMDTYGELDGTQMYEKARQIVQLGSSLGKDGFEVQYTPGELTHYSLVNEITDPRYEDFRRLIFSYFVDGIDVLPFDKEQGMKNLENTIAGMAEFKSKKLSGPSVFLQIFFEAKAQELAQLFKSYPNRQVLSDLIYLDPTNTMIYQNAFDGK
jgi:hypothetical protein